MNSTLIAALVFVLVFGGPSRASPSASPSKPGEELYDKVVDLTPKWEGQRPTNGRAIELMAAMGTTVRQLNEPAGGSLFWPLFVVLVFWLVGLFFGFGLFARRNTTVIATLLVGALTTARAIFLILEMNPPYSGLMQISSAPIRNELAQMATNAV